MDGRFDVVLGFDMETDIGSWTSNYNGFGPGSERILEILAKKTAVAKGKTTAAALRLI